MNENQAISVIIPPISAQLPPSETPAFIFKLWKVLETKEYSQYISWSKNGASFIIFDQNQFSQFVLPNFFKHSHFTSFVRQLNMYGFRKLTNMAYASLTPGQESMEFHHPQFIQGHPNLLEFVKRKSPSSLRIGTRTIKATDLEKLITDFEHIKFEHDKVLREMNDLRNENTSLKSEVVQLKTKYSRHEQVLTRMMNFIILNALYPERTPSLLPGIKRRRKMLELNNSHTLAIPESTTAPLSLNTPYDDLAHTARTLLQPMDSPNIPYQPYFNVDTGFPTQEASRNSLTLYNANYQGDTTNEDFSLALVPGLGREKLQQNTGPHIRDEVRKAVLAKTGAKDNELVQLNRGHNSFPMFNDPNSAYTNDYACSEFDQYIQQDDDSTMEFPESFDSNMLSEFLLPNPTRLDGLQLPSDILHPPLITDSDPNCFRMPHQSDEANNDAQTSLYLSTDQRPHI